MADQFYTCLMFEGDAEDALEFYLSVFEDSSVITSQRFRQTEPMAGALKLAQLRLGEHRIILTNTPNEHDFTFTPSASIFVSCRSGRELNAYAEKLAKGGRYIMPAATYAFSRRYAWVEDRFGVSWQLNLP
ncbi:VOC family protein [Parvularcula sp. ZS-1/3]|uniref:VOC family protein n=1 Tax=Parvularcula mediterranea TaxID=2732508 RepID=A0A7Y3RNH2_9PROT|nr:VOC family protein [Parvularcula mediterranea]NNU17324.1 VOC family protein [Parvularcula mediterranea]